MMSKKTGMIVSVIAGIGAINWGLVGLDNLVGVGGNLVDWLFASLGLPVLADLVYVVVGIAGVMLIVGCCGMCHKKNM